MLTSLSLENFKKHENLQVEFHTGTNLIVGPNWSGKTTLFYAIRYALAGPAAVPGGAKGIKRRGSSKNAKVELSFSSNGRPYKVHRSGNNARLYCGEELVATGASNVTAELADILGIDQKTFFMLRTSPQDEAGSILTLGTSQLGGFINQVTGVDLIDRVIELATEEAVKRQTQLSMLPELDQYLKQKEENLAVHLRGLYSEYAASGNKANELQGAHESATTEAKRLSAAYHAQEQKKRASIQHRARLEEIQKALSNLVEQRKGQPGLRELEAARRGAEAELFSIQQTRKATMALDAEIDALTQQKDTLEADIKKHEAWLAELTLPPEDELEKLWAAVTNTYAQLTNVAQERDTLKHTLNASICVTCKRPLEGAEPEKLMPRLRELEAALPELQEKHRVLSTDQSRYTALMQDKLWYEQLVEKARIELRKVDDRLDSIAEDAHFSTSLEQLEEAERTATKSLFSAQQAYNRINENERSISQLELEIQNVAKLIDEAPEPEIDYEQVTEAERRGAALYAQWKEENNRYMDLTARYTADWQVWNELSMKVAEGEKREEQRKVLAKDEQVLRDLVSYLRKNRDRFTSAIWQALLEICSVFASNCTRGKITEVLRSNDGSFRFVEDGHEATMAEASGVQRAIMGVGVRLALAQALRLSDSFLLLDEITAGASDENSLAVTRALAEAGGQIVMITHRHADAAAADHVISL